MKCEQKGCEKEAVARGNWAGKSINQCEQHCRGMNSLSQIMGGGNMIFTDLETGLSMEFAPK